MGKIRVLVTGKLHQEAVAAFQNHNSWQTTFAPDCTREELLNLVQSCQVLVTRSETTIDREVIEAAKNLKVIARAAVGVGNIHIELATEKGILVVNCPGKNTNSAAELTLGLMLALARHIPEAQGTLKAGGWDRHKFTGQEFMGKTIGIVGLGNVGHRVAKFCLGFDMEVFAYDPYIAPSQFERFKVVAVKSLAELAVKVDVLSVHVPLNKETLAMVDREIISRMNPQSFIVNAARGGIVSEKDLLQALDAGKVAGAAIDTFENEPKPMSQLVKHPRVVCTPHIGASTEEAQRLIGQTVYEQTVKAIEGGVVDYPVNLPQLGVIDNPLVKAYGVLASKLGSLVGQMIRFNPETVEINYRGDIAGHDQSLLKLGFMKGYAAQVVDGFVSYVNAEAHFQKLGIKITETEEPGFVSYKSAVKIIVSGRGGERLTVGGIVFDASYIRISLINDFYFEVEPTGEFLIIENEDKPGVVGDLGQFLGKNQVNIDSFTLSRNRKGGKAMAMVRIDGSLTHELVAQMNKISHVTSVMGAHL